MLDAAHPFAGVRRVSIVQMQNRKETDMKSDVLDVRFSVIEVSDRDMTERRVARSKVASALQLVLDHPTYENLIECIKALAKYVEVTHE